MRQYYLPESIATWQDTLLQSGAGIPVYSGQPYQRGQGIGSFFRGLFRAVWPTVRKVGVTVGKELGREALRTGSKLAKDYLTGEAADVKTRGKQALGRTLSTLGTKLQEGEGLGVRKRKNSIKGILKKRRKKDIWRN
jgi:hypothetical protein